MDITTDFFTATMKATALKIARLAQTDKQEAANYFDMHAEAMSAEEREIFGNAVVDATIAIRS
jgi:hypothetical protein